MVRLALLDRLVYEAKSIAYLALSKSTTNAAAISPYLLFPPWREGPAINAPVLVEAGPTQGWQFAVGKFLYAECPINQAVDLAQPLVFSVNWAPIGSEAAKVVTWQLDFGFYKVGSNLGVIDFTSIAADQPVNAVAGTYQRTTFTIPAITWAADPTIDEIHVRLSRNVSSADPVTDPGIHHQAFIQQLVTG